jgi:hypothetical protein
LQKHEHVQNVEKWLFNTDLWGCVVGEDIMPAEKPVVLRVRQFDPKPVGSKEYSVPQLRPQDAESHEPEEDEAQGLWVGVYLKESPYVRTTDKLAEVDEIVIPKRMSKVQGRSILKPFEIQQPFDALN